MRGHFECDYFGFGPMRGHGPFGHHFGRHGPFGHHGHHGPHHHEHHGHGHHHGKHGHRGHGCRGMRPGFGPFPPPGFGPSERGRCGEERPDCQRDESGPERSGRGPWGRGPWGHGGHGGHGGRGGHGPWGRGCRLGGDERPGSPGCGRNNKEERRGCGCKGKKDQGTQALIIERVIVDNEPRCNSV